MQENLTIWYNNYMFRIFRKAIYEELNKMAGIARQNKTNTLNKNNLSRLFENFPNTIFVTDKQGNVLISNSTGPMTIGMSLDQFLKSNVKDLVNKKYYNKSYTLKRPRKNVSLAGR